MGTFVGLDFFQKFGHTRTDVVHLNAITPSQTNQKMLAIRGTKNIGWHRANLGARLQCLTDQINGHQLIAVLHSRPYG